MSCPGSVGTLTLPPGFLQFSRYGKRKAYWLSERYELKIEHICVKPKSHFCLGRVCLPLQWRFKSAFPCAECTEVEISTTHASPLGPGKGQSWKRRMEGGRRFWVLQMVRKTFASTVINRGKVLCAGRGKHLEVQRADLRERGFPVHTSARGAQADCWGLMGMEIWRGL